MNGKEYHKEWYQRNKDTQSEYMKNWRKVNKDKQQKLSKEWKKENKERVSKHNRKYYQEHREEHSEYEKKYYRENREQVLMGNKKWQQNHPEEYYKSVLRSRKKYLKRLKDNDFSKYMQIKLTKYMRTKISQLVKNKTKHTFDALNYSVNDLINHLEKKFKKYMNWKNYGKMWHIDHIIPESWFSYDSTDDYEFKQCWRLNNLQPKYAKENRKKSNLFADNRGQLEFLI